jgi:Fe-S-cluster containining protein
MTDLRKDFENLKNRYRQIFIERAEGIQKRLSTLNDEEKQQFLENYRHSEIEPKLKEISEMRKKSKCLGCGTCCRFAVSEFSPEELKKKVQNGDNFASQFIKTFVPYNTREDVRKVYPEYVDFLELSGEKDYYFYHCPKVTDNNRCPDYENRPKICRDFPDNPIAFLPPKCGFSDWKEKSEPILLQLRAEMEILEYYQQ